MLHSSKGAAIDCITVQSKCAPRVRLAVLSHRKLAAAHRLTFEKPKSAILRYGAEPALMLMSAFSSFRSLWYTAACRHRHSVDHTAPGVVHVHRGVTAWLCANCWWPAGAALDLVAVVHAGDELLEEEAGRVL